MDNKDEYLVIVRKNHGDRFYYKNRKMHREAGPAIVPAVEKEKYSGLPDEGLYKEMVADVIIIDSDAKELTLNLDKNYEITLVENEKESIVTIPNGKSFVMLEAPGSYFMKSIYCLEGIRYSEKEFNAVLLKNKIEKELIQTESTKKNKKPKI